MEHMPGAVILAAIVKYLFWLLIAFLWSPIAFSFVLDALRIVVS